MKKKIEKVEKKGVSFSKKVILIVLTNSMAMIWASYWLAAHDKQQIAESLSQIVAGTVVFTCLGYFGKSGVENLSKNNTWPDKNGSIKTGTKKLQYNATEVAPEATVEEVERLVVN